MCINEETQKALLLGITSMLFILFSTGIAPPPQTPVVGPVIVQG